MELILKKKLRVSACRRISASGSSSIVLKNFCDEGLIEKSGKQINILDKEGLKEIAGNVYLFMNKI